MYQETLVSNGIDGDRVRVLEAPEDGHVDVEGHKVDLVVSLISWGYHYPVDLYMDSVYELLSEGGVLILDVRRGTDGLDVIAWKFGSYDVVKEERKYLRVCATK